MISMKRIACLAALLLTLTVSAFAQVTAVPALMTFQGRLAKPDGTPLADTNTASLTFRLYTAAAGGTLLWSQTSTNVAVHNGAFGVKLDFSAGFATGQTLKTAFNNTPYLEIQVAPAGSPLTPRQPLTTNAFAFKAGSVADGSVTLGSLAGGVLNYSNISGSLNFSILTGQITAGQIANGAVSYSQLDPYIVNLLNPLSNFGSGPEYLGTVAAPGSGQQVASTNGYLYLLSSSGANGTLFVYNTANPVLPQLAATKTIGANPSFITASGNYVYIIYVTAGSFSNYTSSLQIVDVTTPAAPVLKGTYAFTGNNYVTSLAVAGNFAYAVNYIGNALQILNISNPAAPALVGSTGTDTAPYKVAVSGSYAYVISSSTLQTFSVSGGGIPAFASRVTTASSPTLLTLGNGAAYVSNYNTLQAFSLAAPAAPVLSAALTVNSPYDMTYYNNSLYLLDNNGDQLSQYRVSTPSAPVLNGVTYLVNADYTLTGAAGTIYAARNSGVSAALDIFGIYPVTQYNYYLGVSGDLSAAQNLAVGGDASIAGNLSVGKNITAGGTIAAAGNLSTAANLTATGTISGSSLSVVGAVTSGGGLTAGGPVSGSSLSTTGTLTVGLTASVGALAASSVTATGAAVIGGNAQAASLTDLGGLNVDKNGVGDGTPAKGINFGNASGEGIVSKRTAAPNQYGLDLTTGFTPRLSITNTGNVGINTQTPAFLFDVNGTTAIRGDFKMIQRGGGAGNNGGQGRALVDAGLNQSGIGATGLHINYANDFGQVNIDSPLYVTGTVYSNGTALSSDARYKMNVVPLDNALESLLSLRGVTYDYDRAKWPAKNFPEGKQIGFIAQEVERIFPELVLTDANGYKSVLYQNAVPILIEGMKAQQKQIDALKADNAELKKQNARISELEKTLAAVAAALKQVQKAETAREEVKK